MHVTLCVSGKFTGIDFTDLLRERLPHDSFYTATYTGSDYDADFYMDEPEVTYHPVLDTEPYPDETSWERRVTFSTPDSALHPLALSFKNKSINWNKQILIHNHMMKNIPECDVVMRSRFDTVVSDRIDWNPLIKESLEENIAIGFNSLNLVSSSIRHFHQLNLMQEQVFYYINDALIIHPYKLWNCDLVDELYKDKKLKGAEEGWYQVLSEPYGMYHHSYTGGAYLNEFWDRIIDVDKSLHNQSGE